MTAGEAVAQVVQAMEARDVAVFTTGYISRDAQAAGDRPGHFYMVGSMGLASALALGLALQLPDRRVLVVEGDGSFLMSLGTLALIAHESPLNLVHVVIDNRAYASTGNQPTVSDTVDLAKLAAAAGYRRVLRTMEVPEVADAVRQSPRDAGPTFLHVRVGQVRGPVPPRVAVEPPEIAERFREAVLAAKGEAAT